MSITIELPFGDKALTPDQAAAYIGLAATTLAVKRCKGGGPPFLKYSARAVRYRLTDLDRWMEERTLANTAGRRAA